MRKAYGSSRRDPGANLCLPTTSPLMGRLNSVACGWPECCSAHRGCLNSGPMRVWPRCGAPPGKGWCGVFHGCGACPWAPGSFGCCVCGLLVGIPPSYQHQKTVLKKAGNYPGVWMLLDPFKQHTFALLSTKQTTSRSTTRKIIILN